MIPVPGITSVVFPTVSQWSKPQPVEGFGRMAAAWKLAPHVNDVLPPTRPPHAVLDMFPGTDPGKDVGFVRKCTGASITTEAVAVSNVELSIKVI